LQLFAEKLDNQIRDKNRKLRGDDAFDRLQHKIYATTKNARHTLRLRRVEFSYSYERGMNFVRVRHLNGISIGIRVQHPH